jgi:ATP-binding cassette, subfamily B, bacterial
VIPRVAGARITRTTTGLAWGALRLVASANPGGFAAAAGLQVLGAAAVTAVVIAGKLALDVIVNEDPTSGGLIGPLVALAVASALSTAVTGLQTHQQRLLGEDAGVKAWARLLAVTGRTDLSSYESPAFHDRVERLKANAITRPASIATAALGILGSSLSVASLAAAVYVLEPLLLPTLLIAGVPAVVLARRASATEFAFAKAWTATWRRRQYVRELLTERRSAQEVRAFETQAELERRHLEASGAYRTGLAAQVRRRQVLALVVAACNATLLALTLVIIVLMLDTGRLSLSEAGAAVIAVRLLSGQLDRFLGSMSTIIEAGSFLHDLDDFIRTTDVEADPSTERWPLASGLQARAVRFRYPGATTDALAGLDLEVRPGQVVALVGENGSGKTTLAKVLAGLYRPTSGELCWDGRLLTEGDGGAHRRSTSVLFQDFVRYEMTVAENILLTAGRDADAGAIVERSARDAGFLAVTELPHGLHTQLGRMFEDGIDLSGGQWQRLALARALVRDTPLIVLDEPSSALDPAAEHRLFSDVRALVRDRAVVLVSHRYANLHLADRIYVLQDGRVVESGAHADLMAQGGVYSELYRLQAEAFQLA